MSGLVAVVLAAIAESEVVAVVVGAAAAVTLPTIGLIAGGLTIGVLVTLYATAPRRQNKTMLDIQAHHQLQMLRATLDNRTYELELLRRTNELEQLRNAVAEKTQTRVRQEFEAEEETGELDRTRAAEEAEMEKPREQEHQVLRDQQRSLTEEEKRIAGRKQKLEEQILDSRQRLKDEQEMAATGIQPIQWPTEDEFRAAQDMVQYNESNFHFAIVGKAGCGKSSLINAFINLNPTHAGAARTGITETTLKMARYPDPGTKAPRPWTVWFDIPGAGTQRISHWQYFTNHALFVFDVIILVVGDRFEETDCQIVRSCKEFKIPFLIVRSKADQHIKNMMEDEDDSYQGPFDSGEFYDTCRQRFIELSKQMVSEELERAGLPVQTVYCVSRRALRIVYNNSLEESVDSDDESPEMALVKELMLAAYQRRSGIDGAVVQPGLSIQETTMGSARAAYTTVSRIIESRIGMASSTENSHQSFSPDASIPPQLMAFGMDQVPTLYQDMQARAETTSASGSSIHTCVDRASEDGAGRFTGLENPGACPYDQDYEHYGTRVWED